MRVLVIGASGMLGSAALATLAARPGIEPVGTLRDAAAAGLLPERLRAQLRAGVDADRFETVERVLAAERPDVVLNAVGVIKQREAGADVLGSVPLNTLFPHRLAQSCAQYGARLVHISTDCVFSGRTGGYGEDDPADATDVYGLSKYLGEVRAAPALTLRTSIIGPEPRPGGASLLDWFLAQSGRIDGYRQAIFSGLPTVELARVIAEHILPRPELTGLYHVAAAPISKFDLLRLVATAYGKRIEITPVDAPRIDRSLDGARFRAATGYVAAPWPDLVAAMRAADRRSFA